MHNNFRTTQCTHVAPDLINLDMKSNPPRIHDHRFVSKRPYKGCHFVALFLVPHITTNDRGEPARS